MAVDEVGTLGQVEFGGDPFSNIGYIAIKVINTTTFKKLRVGVKTAGDTLYVDWGDGSTIEQGANLNHNFEPGGPDRLVTILSLNSWQTIKTLRLTRDERGTGYWDVSDADFSGISLENVLFGATNPISNLMVRGSITASRQFAKVTNEYQYNGTDQATGDLPREVDQLIGSRGAQLSGDAMSMPSNMSKMKDVNVSGDSLISSGGPVGLGTSIFNIGVGNVHLDPQSMGLSSPGSGSPIENLVEMDYGRTQQDGWDRILFAGRSLLVIGANEERLDGYDFRGQNAMPPNIEEFNFRKRGFNSYIFDDYSFCDTILFFQIGDRDHLYNTNDSNNENQLPILYDAFYNNRSSFSTDENGNPKTVLRLRRDDTVGDKNLLSCASSDPQYVRKMAGMFGYHMDGVFDYVKRLTLSNFFRADARKKDDSTLIIPISINDASGDDIEDAIVSVYRYDPNNGNRIEAYVDDNGSDRWMPILEVEPTYGYQNDRFRLDGDGVHEEFRISSYSYDPNAGSNGELTVNIDTGAGGNLSTSIPDFADGEAEFVHLHYFETDKP